MPGRSVLRGVMMDNALYAMYFTGVAGSGLGMVAFLDGVVAGADATGGIIDGTYKVDDAGKLVGSVKMSFPAGATLVTGGPVAADPFSIAFPLVLSPDLGDGSPILVKLPTGPVNVIFKKLRNLPGHLSPDSTGGGGG